MKNNIIIFIILGIIILVALVNPIKNEEKTASMTATYYDSQGKEVYFKPYNYAEAMKQTKNNLMSIFQSFGIVFNPVSENTCSQGYNDWHSIFGNYFYGQTFIAGYSNGLTTGKKVNITYAQASFYKNDVTYGSIYAQIREVYGTINEGSTRTSISLSDALCGIKTFSVASIPENSDFTAGFNFDTPCQLTVGTKYALIFDTGSVYDGDLEIRLKNSEVYTVGGRVFSSNDGSTFSTWGGTAGTYDYCTSIGGGYTTCNPESCSAQGKTCGVWSDTCSAVLDCGPLTSGNYQCNSSGQYQLIPTASYRVNIVNNGQVPYSDIKIVSTNPSELFSYFPTNTFSLSQGQSNSWLSNNITISNYHGTNLTVFVSANNTYNSQLNNFQSSIMIA
jgi:hypothetical protein